MATLSHQWEEIFHVVFTIFYHLFKFFGFSPDAKVGFHLGCEVNLFQDTQHNIHVYVHISQ